MRAKFIGLVAVVLMASSVARAEVVSWANLYTGDACNNPFYTPAALGPVTMVPDGNDYYAFVFAVVGTMDPISGWTIGSHTFGDDTRVIGNAGGMYNGGVAGGDPFACETPTTYYVRLFNRDPLTWDGTGSMYAVNAGGAAYTWSINGTAVPNAVDSPDIRGSLTDGSDWVLIPEPGTLALLGIGLAVVAGRRAMKKR